MTAVEDWLAYLTTERGRSRNTVTLYRSVLGSLPGDPATATRDDLEAWWRARATDRDGNPRPHSSRNTELAAVRSFYKWLLRYEHREDDPTRRIDTLREQRRESRFIGTEELAHLLRKLPPDLKRAVALGAYGGLRVSEAAALDWADIHLDHGPRRMIVRGKGDKERAVAVPIPLLDILLPNTGGNVVTGRPEAYDGHYLQVKVNEAMRRNGASLTFHALRHRFGYMSASGGVAPTSIARAMGHANLATTMRYVAAVDSDLDLIGEAVTR